MLVVSGDYCHFLNQVLCFGYCFSLTQDLKSESGESMNSIEILV